MIVVVISLQAPEIELPLKSGGVKTIGELSFVSPVIGGGVVHGRGHEPEAVPQFPFVQVCVIDDIVASLQVPVIVLPLFAPVAVIADMRFMSIAIGGAVVQAKGHDPEAVPHIPFVQVWVIVVPAMSLQVPVIVLPLFAPVAVIIMARFVSMAIVGAVVQGNGHVPEAVPHIPLVQVWVIVVAAMSLIVVPLLAIVVVIAMARFMSIAIGGAEVQGTGHVADISPQIPFEHFWVIMVVVSSQVAVMVVPLVTGVDTKSVEATLEAVLIGGTASQGAGPLKKDSMF